MSEPLVLVTGASGFVATHVVRLLQEEGYRVRGTVRNLKDEKKVKHLYNLVPDAKHKVELVEANLLNEDCWKDAVKDCEYIMHVASPFPGGSPRNEDDLILPAVNGTLNVLKAAAAAGGVKRVVLTSSCAAICREGGNTQPYTENDWTPDDKDTSAYCKSKLRAEKAAWEFVKNLADDQKFELAVVNPSLVIGPPMHGNPGTSTEFLKKLLEREFFAAPNLCLYMVDVRDVALTHLKCMTMPEAVGNRHICSTGTMWIPNIAAVLDKEFRSQGYNVPTGKMPGVILTVVSWFNSEVKNAKSAGTKETLLDNTRMTKVLGIQPIELSKSLIDMAYAEIELGFVKKTPQYRGRSQS